MAIQIAPPSRWSAKHIILVATIATLAAVAIAAAISISLAPAHIHFAIANAKIHDYGISAVYYNFTIVVNNTSWDSAKKNHTSWRPKVHFAALSYKIWYSQNGWVPDEVNTSALQWNWLRPGKTRYINASSKHSQYTEVPATPPYPSTTAASTGSTAAGGIDWPNCSVEVTAKVWFKFGLACTRPYNVRTSCFPVDFVNGAAYAECKP